MGTGRGSDSKRVYKRERQVIYRRQKGEITKRVRQSRREIEMVRVSHKAASADQSTVF